ncbi:hypothetical protein BGZ65_002180, partial [Modicella reniformis]
MFLASPAQTTASLGRKKPLKPSKDQVKDSTASSNSNSNDNNNINNNNNNNS